ncbi:MAG: DUF1579 family protein [Acidobacteria bacterium]|nr:DUF1579 family protein [Acidobacteriota bacterium]
MRLALVSILSLSSFALVAQAPAPAAPAPAPKPVVQEAPKPGPEMDRLKVLVGSFKVDEHFSGPGAPSVVGAGFSRVSEGPGGFTLLINYSTLSGPQHGMKGHGVMGWDAGSGTYKQVWVDSMGPMIEVATGNWEGDSFVLKSSGTMNGKPYQSRTTISAITADGFTVTGEMSMDGGPMQKVIELNHHRIAPAGTPAPAAK